jgi:hypothetical protein
MQDRRSEAARYRHLADMARQQARSIVSPAVRVTHEEMAKDFDRIARRLELEASRDAPPVTRADCDRT